MRVLVDGVAFENHFQVGVQRYFREVLGRVGRTERVTITLGAPPRAALPAGCAVARVPRPPGDFDLFQTTRFTCTPDARLPQVLAIHDMVPELHWRFGTPEMDAEVRAKAAAGADATRITCISHAAAADIRSLHPDWADKIRVIYPGADHLRPGMGDGAVPPKVRSRRFWRNWLRARDARRGAADLAGRPYVLFVGDRGGYKNFDAVTTALTDPSWDPDLLLAVVGGPLGDAERAALATRGVAGRVKWLGRVSDRRLADLYAGAACFVFPSKAEGLGFPLLEAQVAGAPVVCSDTAVFREVAGPDGAIFFDPADPAALARAVRGIRDRPPTAGWLTRARANVDRFRWDRCARRCRSGSAAR